MDIGAEISKKIQMAITAKLKELNAYVDDELPDYIMIMVANKKTEEQMTDALSLFLSGSTETFTSWLHALLASLRKSKSDKKAPQHEAFLEERENELPVLEEQTDATGNTSSSENIKLIGMQKPTIDLTINDAIDPVTEISHAEEPVETVEESAFSEAIITINPGHNDVFDDDLLEDISSSIEGKKCGGNSKEEIEKSSGDGAKLAFNEISFETKDVSEIEQKNLKRKSLDLSTSKHQDLEEKRGKSMRADGKRSDSKQSMKVVKPSKQRLKPDNHYQKQHPATREWDVGKDENRRWKSRSTKRVHHGNKLDFYSDTESDDGLLKSAKSSMSSAVNQIIQDPEFVSESESEGEIAKISSRVTYPERKIRVPLDKQANKSLFVKAVSAAEKSVKRDRPTVLTRRQMSPSAKVRRKRSIRSKPDTSAKPSRSTRSHLSDGNDEHRKLFFRKAIGTLLYSDMVDRRECTKPTSGPRTGRDENRVTKKLPLTRKLSPAGNDHEKRVAIKRSGKKSNQNVIFVHGSTSDEDERKFVSHDRREFIVTTKNHPCLTAVKFDSRQTVHSLEEALTNNQVPQVSASKDPALISNSAISSKGPVQKQTSPSPNFIVTLDGVVRDKHVKLEGKEEENKVKQFKFQPVTASTNVTKPSVRAVATLDHTNTHVKQEGNVVQDIHVKHEESKTKQFKFQPVAASASLIRATTAPTKPRGVIGAPESSKTANTTLTELEKMKKKLAEVQKESTELKKMHAKLAAAQAQMVSAVPSPATAKRDLAEAEQRSIYIGNVHYSTTVKQLSEYFSICGKIARATILKDETTGHPKGFAYLEFEDKGAVSSALALNNTQLNHRAIRVTLKQQKPAAPKTTYPGSRSLHRARGSRAVTSAFRFGHNFTRVGRMGGVKMIAKNRTWINPLLAQASK